MLLCVLELYQHHTYCHVSDIEAVTKKKNTNKSNTSNWCLCCRRPTGSSKPTCYKYSKSIIRTKQQMTLLKHPYYLLSVDGCVEGMYLTPDNMINGCKFKLGIPDKPTCSTHETQPLTTVIEPS